MVSETSAITTKMDRNMWGLNPTLGPDTFNQLVAYVAVTTTGLIKIKKLEITEYDFNFIGEGASLGLTKNKNETDIRKQ